MKHIIITGANGLVATELIFTLLDRTDYIIYLLSTDEKKLYSRYEKYMDRVRIFSLYSFADFCNTLEDRIAFDVCIHTAFSRSSDGANLVFSLEYQRRLIEIIRKVKVDCFVNISSQSVYGKVTEPLWKENAPLCPDYLYAMGKYASEIITELMFENTDIKWTNIRLCSIMENARFVRVFVQNALDNKPIHLTAPDQYSSFVDVRDVADAILCLIQKVDLISLEKTYNLGANNMNSIKEIAIKVKEIGEQKYGTSEVLITEVNSDNNIKVGMDASHFMKIFDWHPQFGIDSMIISIFEMLKNPSEEMYPKSFKIVYKL